MKPILVAGVVVFMLIFLSEAKIMPSLSNVFGTGCIQGCVCVQCAGCPCCGYESCNNLPNDQIVSLAKRKAE